MRAATLLLLLAVWTSAADLPSVSSEPNLERRSEKALDNADRAITDARDSYLSGNVARAKTSLEEVVASVELCRDALMGTGKSPRRSPKYFKRAELKIHELLRRLASLEEDFDAADRQSVLQAETRLHEVRDDLVNGIMSKKK